MKNDRLSFIKEERFSFIYLCGMIILEIIVFYLFALNIEGLILLIGFQIAGSIVYWITKWIKYSRKKQLKAQLDALKNKQKQFEQSILQKESDQANYLLLWSHQIKTPVTALRLMANTLEENDRYAVEEQVLQIEQYANMLMSYMKLMAPAADLDIEWVDLDPLIKTLLKQYRILFIKNEIKIDYRSLSIQVLTDQKWLQVMLEQFFMNVIKYAPKGKLSLIFDINTQMLHIQDEGMGIEASDIPRIFEKGYSGMNGRFHEKSSGLGLYLVQTIAHRLNHQVSVVSTVGKGTDFMIFFDHIRVSS